MRKRTYLDVLSGILAERKEKRRGALASAFGVHSWVGCARKPTLSSPKGTLFVTILSFRHGMLKYYHRAAA
jgi:hypothetical protein